jgi:hypothetical protein
MTTRSQAASRAVPESSGSGDPRSGDVARRQRAAGKQRATAVGRHAEGVGFEPTKRDYLLAVFKTAAIGH